MKSFRLFRIVPRREIVFISLISGLILLSVFSFGCAPDSSQSGSQNPSESASNDLPELNDDVIRERINDAGVWEVPEENGAAEPISWHFNENEPKEIRVVDKQINDSRATLILDIKTRSAVRARNPRELAGQIRTEWELKSGWALRRWEIVKTENISMKYKNLPKPPAQNSNR